METKKNVLLITYYWPPSGGAGVHRWLRFSKYFSKNGVEFTVYCPKDAAWPIIDEGLMKQVPEDITVVRRKIFEPQKFFKQNTTGVGFTEQQKPSAIKKLIVWIRGNLFIPDSRVFWISPSTRFLTNYLKNHPEIDTIISSGPPHSMHLIALNLKRKNPGLKWLADFRDPWTQIDFYDDLMPGKRADQKQKHFEQLCLKEADEVITVSEACATGLQEIVDREVHVITNGFEFPEFDPEKIVMDEKFTISHFGSMPNARNPFALWEALGKLIREDNDFREKLKVRLIGTVDYKVIEAAKRHNLEEFIELVEPVNHEESIRLQRSTQVLLLVANNSGNVKGILTGKFFEYLGAKRPILAIGQNGSNLNTAMDKTEAGCFAGFDESAKVYSCIKEYFERFKEGTLNASPKNLSDYSSENLAEKIIALF